MIVSAGYFSSRRAPSFQSSHETAISGPRPEAPVPDPPPSSGLTPQAPLSLLPANQAGIHTLRSSSPHRTQALTLQYKVLCVNLGQCE